MKGNEEMESTLKQVKKEDYLKIMEKYYLLDVALKLTDILYEEKDDEGRIAFGIGKSLNLISAFVPAKALLEKDFCTDTMSSTTSEEDVKLANRLFNFLNQSFIPFMSSGLQLVPKKEKTNEEKNHWNVLYGKAIRDRNALLLPFFPVDWLAAKNVINKDTKVFDIGTSLGMYSWLFKICLGTKHIIGMDKKEILDSARVLLQGGLPWDVTIPHTFPPLPDVEKDVYFISEVLHTMSIEKAKQLLTACYDSFDSGTLIVNELIPEKSPYTFWMNKRLEQCGSKGELIGYTDLVRMCENVGWNECSTIYWGPCHYMVTFKKGK